MVTKYTWDGNQYIPCVQQYSWDMNEKMTSKLVTAIHKEMHQFFIVI